MAAPIKIQQWKSFHTKQINAEYSNYTKKIRAIKN